MATPFSNVWLPLHNSKVSLNSILLNFLSLLLFLFSKNFNYFFGNSVQYVLNTVTPPPQLFLDPLLSLLINFVSFYLQLLDTKSFYITDKLNLITSLVSD